MGMFDDLIPSKPQASGGAFADLVPQQKKPTRPEPDTELTIGERFMTSLPKGLQDWFSDPSVAGVDLGKGSAVHGAMEGAADPTVGAVQLAANAVGQGDGVNQAIAEHNAEYEDARAGQGREGFDAARLAGNFATSSLAGAAALPIKAASSAGKVIQGVRSGVVGGAIAPVTDADSDFASTKAGQMLFGGLAGGILTPIAGKVGEIVSRFRNRTDPQAITQQADEIVAAGVERLQREGITLPANQLAALRAQVMSSLRDGVEIDMAAAARKADFEALGMQPTLGQITRDPATYSREMNLRGVAGVGEPLTSRMGEQSRRLQELIAEQSKGAADDFTAGQSIQKALQGFDDGMSKEVSTAYSAARDSLGRAAGVDSNAFSRAANQVLDEQMLGSSLPSEARKILNDVTAGKIPLTVNSTVLIDRRLSELQRDMTRQGKGSAVTALGVVRDALHKAPIADNVGEEAKAMFDVGRAIARDRFKTHELIPALKSAIDGDVSAQDFVKRFIVNGKAEEVGRLAKVLTPEARDEARKQFGAVLERVAYGANTAGDKTFAQESFNKFLQSPGMKQKMLAFFSPEEVANFERIGRVAAYKHSFPADSTVNTSNTAAAVANLISRIPGMPAGVALLQSAKNAAGNQLAVKSSIAAKPGVRPSSLTPEQQALLERIIGASAMGAGVSSGRGVVE